MSISIFEEQIKVYCKKNEINVIPLSIKAFAITHLEFKFKQLNTNCDIKTELAFLENIWEENNQNIFKKEYKENQKQLILEIEKEIIEEYKDSSHFKDEKMTLDDKINKLNLISAFSQQSEVTVGLIKCIYNYYLSRYKAILNLEKEIKETANDTIINHNKYNNSNSILEDKNQKKCPFCGEQIQIEALKCRYCNEWLNKENPISDFFNKTKKFIQEKKQEYQDKKEEHLFMPTNENPLIIKKLMFYADRIQIFDNVFKIDKLTVIYIAISENTVNFSTSRYFNFMIIGINEKEVTNTEEGYQQILIASTNDNSVLGSKLTKKEFEQLVFMFNYISKISFTNRLNIMFLESLIKNNYFTYSGYNFYENGDIKKENKLIANIKVERDNISLGSSYTGIHTSSRNPYEFLIQTDGIKMKLFGYQTGIKLKIETYSNHDIFESLILHYIKNGYYFIQK